MGEVILGNILERCIIEKSILYSNSAEKKNRPREGVAEGGVAQKMFELHSKNTAKNHISKNQGWKPRRKAPWLFLTISQKVKIGGGAGIRIPSLSFQQAQTVAENI